MRLLGQFQTFLFIYFFLRKDFTRTKSTKNTKNTEDATKQKHKKHKKHKANKRFFPP